jgi:short-subunit dehydrogenase
MNRTQSRNSRKTVLLTGASTGIGYELTRLFARDRYNLVLVARAEEKLTQMANNLHRKYGVQVKVLAKDLSLPSTPDDIFAELERESISVDILVNNAGFGTYGAFSKTDLATELQMMQVNMVALTHLTKLLLPVMLRRGHGKILNVASTAAFQPGPGMANYYATKAYVVSFSLALADELRGSGVSVTTLCPGPTRTEFQQRAAMQGSRLVSGTVMDAKTVAVSGYRGLLRNQVLVIPGLKNKAFALLSKILPARLVMEIIRAVHQQETKANSTQAKSR